MTEDIDALLEGQPIEPPTLSGAAGRPAKCRRHQWVKNPVYDGTERQLLIATGQITGNIADIGKPSPTFHYETMCLRCGTVKDEARSRRARNNGKRGRAIQAKRITALGGRNLAGNNENLDGLGEMFAYESKSGAAFSDRYWRWLTGIPKRGNETGVLIVTDTPGRGHKARSYVVVEFSEWKDLHGE